MGDDHPDRREQGIDFGELATELPTLHYPIDKEELLESHGSTTLDLVNGETTLREILETDDVDTYEDEESVRQSVFSLVGDEAVGREDYTDRGGSAQVQDSADEPESI